MYNSGRKKEKPNRADPTKLRQTVMNQMKIITV